MIHLLRPLTEVSCARALRRNLRNSTVEGSSYSLMVGTAETWFGAFYIAAGIGTFSVGLLATLPILIGSLLQFGTPWGIRRVGSYRAWAFTGAAFQGLSLVGMAICCLANCLSIAVVFSLMVIYWASSLAVGPAWNTWMEFVIPRAVRTRYLSARMRVCQIALLIAVLVTGGVLQLTVPEYTLVAFGILFLLAGVFRLISAVLLGSHTEQPSWILQYVSATLQKRDDTSIGKVIRQSVPFFVAIQFSVYVSGPFFAPFMLRTMGMSYAGFMLLILLGYVGRILTLRLAGEIARVWGPGRLLWLGAMGVIPLSGLWWFYESFAFLIILQLAGGVAWGCYELAMSIVFIERIPRHLRTRVLSIFGVCNGFAMVGGSLLGGAIVFAAGNSVLGFMVIFSLSTLLRLASMALFPSKLLMAAKQHFTRTADPLIPATPCLNGRPTVGPFNHLPTGEPKVSSESYSPTELIEIESDPEIDFRQAG
ncbi:MAG TPA: hypothetical protein PKD64_03320 [Pirellulaceae bacterium]|nr:hypothetical protein [Pirellulaceae bacterium]